MKTVKELFGSGEFWRVKWVTKQRKQPTNKRAEQTALAKERENIYTKHGGGH